jgi:hypothetical protein
LSKIIIPRDKTPQPTSNKSILINNLFKQEEKSNDKENQEEITVLKSLVDIEKVIDANESKLTHELNSFRDKLNKNSGRVSNNYEVNANFEEDENIEDSARRSHGVPSMSATTKSK